jgi:hypothetical protein
MELHNLKSYILAGTIVCIVALGSWYHLRPQSQKLSGTPVYTTAQGGTGTSSPSGILYADGSLRLKTVEIGSNLTFSGGTLSATGGSGSGDPFAWTPGTDGNATSTRLIFGNGFISQASSTLTAGLTLTTATATAATTTSFFATTASTSKLYLATGNGILKTTAGLVGLAIADTDYLTPDTADATYLTGNENITLSGDVSGTGATSITTSIGTGKVTNAMLAGSIANAKLVNSAISGVALGGSLFTLTHGNTLTGTTYDGSAAVDNWDIDLSNPNTWSGLQTFSGIISASSTLGTFTGTLATTSAATTTSLFATTASSTNFFGAGLPGAGCTGSSNKLVWSAGMFACAADQTGGTSFGQAWELSSGALAPTTTTGIIVSASSTFASSLNITGNATTSNLNLPSGGAIGWNNGALTLTHSSNFLTLAGGGFRTTAAGIGVNKANSASIALDVKADSTFTQGVRVEADLSTRLGLSSFVTGDAFTRFSFRVDGKLIWGDGSAGGDTDLYRSAANELMTDDNFVIAGNSTTTNATTTNLFSTTASSTNLFASVFNFGGILSLASHTITAAAGAILDFSSAVTLRIPTASAPTINNSGVLAYDTTSGNLIMGTSTATGAGGAVIASATSTLYSFAVASTSPVLKSGGSLKFPATYTAEVATAIICQVTSGTSVVINLSNEAGSSDTNTITCTTTSNEYKLTANNTYASLAVPLLEVGTVTGAVDWLTVRVVGYKTSD